jgi:small subunit ribosomal protein S6
MFLLDSAKAAVNWEETVHQVHGILTKHNAEIVASRQWDDRRLAYTVNGHKKGSYLLTYFKSDGASLRDIEHDCSLHELIVRDLILKVHPKLVDHLVTQAMSSTPGSESEDGGPPEEELDDRPRRRRRDD